MALNDEKHLINDPGHYKNPSSTAKCKIIIGLAILIPTLLAIGCAVGVAVLGIKLAQSNTQQVNVCTSASCVNLAATVINTMDLSIDPCQDFYNYSCGGWDNTNVIPSGHGNWGVFGELDQRNNIAIRKLLEGNEEGNVRAIQLARQLYQSCMNINGLTQEGASPLLTLLNQTGGWSLIGLLNSTAPAWSIMSSDFVSSMMNGNDAFFSFSIEVNDKNSSEYIPALSQDGLTLPSSDSYKDNKTINTTIPALKKFISSILKLLGPNIDDSVYSLAADQIIEFENDLANIFVSAVDLRDPQATYNLFKLSDLSNQSLWTQFNWTQYMIELFNTSAGVTTISGDLIVNVRTPSYFMNLTNLYTRYNASVLENYFKWHLVKSYIPYLGNDFLSVYYEYTSVVLGSGKVERYLTCVQSLENFVPMSVSRLYTKYVLPSGTRGNISEIVSQIKTAFQQRLSKNTFLDAITIQRSIWKVGNISQMIAYPDNITNDDYLLNKSEAVIEANGQYFQTAVSNQLIETRDNLRKLGRPVISTEWEIAPTAVNAYYEPLYNEFVFLEGILNSPFFQADWPSYFKYGAFGVVAGHELTHGFDDQGQQYNQDGVLTPWWTNQSVAAFKRKKQCFVDQYSKYSMFGYHVNGQLTQGENIADNGGVHTAFQAYKNVIGTETPPSLQAIDLTPDQLFFISFGQVWCSIFSPQFIQSDVKTNPHSPGPYRVIGALSNSEDFAKAFNCPVNSPMNPKEKCDLW